MKKLAFSFVLVLSLSLFTACSLKEEAGQLVEDGKESYENIKEEEL